MLRAATNLESCENSDSHENFRLTSRYFVSTVLARTVMAPEVLAPPLHLATTITHTSMHTLSTLSCISLGMWRAL